MPGKNSILPFLICLVIFCTVHSFHAAYASGVISFVFINTNINILKTTTNICFFKTTILIWHLYTIRYKLNCLFCIRHMLPHDNSMINTNRYRDSLHYLECVRLEKTLKARGLKILKDSVDLILLGYNTRVSRFFSDAYSRCIEPPHKRGLYTFISTDLSHKEHTIRYLDKKSQCG
jgi:hypothetical protein